MMEGGEGEEEEFIWNLEGEKGCRDAEEWQSEEWQSGKDGLMERRAQMSCSGFAIV